MKRFGKIHSSRFGLCSIKNALSLLNSQPNFMGKLSNALDVNAPIPKTKGRCLPCWGVAQTWKIRDTDIVIKLG
jgi:hypothetical protein